MAETIESIRECLHSGKNFLLSGGAGSGKTFSLVQTLKSIYTDNPLANVACITFTNVAVDQIKRQVDYEQLVVSTIHDFLWDIIEPFQHDVAIALSELVKTESIRCDIPDFSYEFLKALEKKIQYQDWKSLKDGVICHDEVLQIAEYLFENTTLLSHILKDRYQYILVDEYQDTYESTIRILLDHLPKSERIQVVGFFGDSMQSIFGSGGDIAKYVQDGRVVEIEKADNRRNPLQVLNLINQLRFDKLQQKIADNPPAQNHGIEGRAIFLHSKNDFEIDNLKQLEYFEDWDFENPEQTKELYLVHKLIAGKVGFPTLMDIYTTDRILQYKEVIKTAIKDGAIAVDETRTFGEIIDQLGIPPTPIIKEFIDANPELYDAARNTQYSIIKSTYIDRDELIGDKRTTRDVAKKKVSKRDALINHLFSIRECVHLYTNGKFNQFIKKTHYPISSVHSKIALRNAIETLVAMNEDSIEAVIEYADNAGIWKKDDSLKEFIERKRYVYERVKRVSFKELVSVYDYVEGYTPYSTQHNIKGAEFDNVLVVLDNGNWNMYNFKYLFEKTKNKDEIIKRTQKLFYVCCSRAMRNLVVFYEKAPDGVVEQAQTWFDGRVYRVD